MITIIEILAAFVIFFLVAYLSWYFTEKKHMPAFLDYKPWKCRLCLNMWSLVAIYLSLGISFKLWALLITGITMAILNAIAMWINQKENTVSIDDINIIYED